MAGSVIIRDGHSITEDGVIRYADRLIEWSEADDLAGIRLDRRKAWAFVDGELCECVRWSQGCSGCNGELAGDRGFGCTECGYHGIVRQAMWVPAYLSQSR